VGGAWAREGEEESGAARGEAVRLTDCRLAEHPQGGESQGAGGEESGKWARGEAVRSTDCRLAEHPRWD